MEKVAKCMCGQFRSVVNGELRSVAMCHCLAFKRRSGSAFAYNAFYQTSDVRLERTYKIHQGEGQQRHEIERHFCPEFGTTVYSRTAKFPGICNIPASALADPTFPTPLVSLFEESNHAWFVPPPGIEHCVRGPAPGAVRPDADQCRDANT
ncbi:GFA family protein [Falsiroseomonas sp. E2-1-a20]|uniref:GFA family protein n=1 Tax=Falsiroseomonas sp. E2-1-a20 TaxID=3239300 RepID=UPI003F2BE87A